MSFWNGGMLYSVTGQKTDDLDDVFYSKILDEDVSDTGVIAAFESFTNQLKKTFWVIV